MDRYEIRDLKLAADVAEIKKATAELNAFKLKFSSVFDMIKYGLSFNVGARRQCQPRILGGRGGRLSDVKQKDVPQLRNVFYCR